MTKSPSALRHPAPTGAAPARDGTSSHRVPWPPDPLRYLDGRLCVGDLPLEEVVAETGTPAYVYDLDAVAAAYRRVAAAFEPLAARVLYAVKANANLAVLATLAGLGSGFDVVSGGRVGPGAAGRRRPGGRASSPASARPPRSWPWPSATASPSTWSRPTSWTPWRRWPPGWSGRPASRSASTPTSRPTPTPTSTPATTRPSSASRSRSPTSCWPGRPGASCPCATRSASRPRRLAAPRPRGRCRRGQGRAGGARGRAGRPGWSWTGSTSAAGCRWTTPAGRPSGPSCSRPRWRRCWPARNVRLAVEPGRALVARAGALVAGVLYRKHRSAGRMLVVDTGMHHLLRPALYQAVHRVGRCGRPRWPARPSRRPHLRVHRRARPRPTCPTWSRASWSPSWTPAPTA